MLGTYCGSCGDIFVNFMFVAVIRAASVCQGLVDPQGTCLRLWESCLGTYDEKGIFKFLLDVILKIQFICSDEQKTTLAERGAFL